MKLREYIQLKDSANDVCEDIDSFLNKEVLNHYGSTEALLVEARETIMTFHSLIDRLLSNVDIEDIV